MGTFHVTYQAELRVVECTAAGFLNVDELMEAAICTIAQAVEKHTNLILVDDTGVEKTVGAVEIYEMPGVYDDLGFDRGIKIAIILPDSPEAKEGVRFYETVCKNRGWNVELFEKRQEAIDWLTGGRAPGVPNTDAE